MKKGGYNLRILYSSNAPWASSGYGVQGQSLLPRLAELPEIDGRDNIGIFAWYGLQGGIHNVSGFRVYPAGADAYGNDIIAAHTRDFQANVVISLIDVWVMHGTAEKVKPALWCPWLPIDHDPVPQRVLDCLKGAHLPLTYSKWGHEMLTGAGVENHYIPHGVEPGVFRVLEDRDKVNEFRAAIFGPECKHLSVIVAANKGYPDRKAFQVQIRAWAAFAKDKPGAKLYIHTEPTTMYGGLDLPELCKSLGILDRVMFPDRYKNFLGMPADYMALIYNAADVYLGATMSEGFGIPIVEAQACGTPVIVTDFSAMPELVRWGYAIQPRDMFWTPQNAWQAWPDHEGITDALHSLYSSLLHNAGRPTLHDRLKTSTAIHNEYSWDVIVRDQWRPLMTRLAGEVAGAQTAIAPITTAEKRKAGKVLKLVEPKEVYQNGQKEPVAA
jgi:glycosyltransferase involved in cell wall biosynthesis